MTEVVRFYRDGSLASQRVERELVKRGMEFVVLWGDNGGRPVPAIESRGGLFEGLSNVEVYFFGLSETAAEVPSETALRY